MVPHPEMPAPDRSRVMALVGATATGKTAVAEAIAARLGVVIVCADSRQVFRELNAGTGKPSPTELASRPHVMFDALTLGQRASAGWYARAAGAACRAILDRGLVPLLVGGSGLYLKALMSGLSGEPPHDATVRARLIAEAARLGTEALHERLRDLDPATARRLHPSDTQRVTRALEVVETSGRTLSWWHAQESLPGIEADWSVVELELPPGTARPRIEARTRAMFDAGLLDEARALVAAGHEEAVRALRAVGYDEAFELLHGRMDRASAEARTSLRTRQLAKRQRTWFRHQIEAVRLDAARSDDEALVAEVVAAFAAEPRRPPASN